MSKPLVSILINAFNEERFMRETLDSAIAQTYENIEILVLDDHSKDKTAEIVKEYAARDSRVRYVLPDEPRLGLIEGRNRLLKEARGEFLTYLDADDIYLPDKVAAEVEFLEAHPEFAIVYCKIGYFYDGTPEKIYRHQYAMFSDESTESEKKVFTELLEKMFITNTAVMMRREIYDKLGGYRTDLGIVEDWEFFLRMTYAGYKIGFLDQDLVRYRLRWDSHTNFKRMVIIQQSAVNIFEDLKKKMSPEERERYRIDYWIAKRRENYVVALAGNGEGAKAREILREIAPHVRPAKRWAIITLSYFPASVAAFLLEQAWQMKKKNLFIRV